MSADAANDVATTPGREVIETAGEGNDAKGVREKGWKRW
jgi:hypothetical protein